VRDADVRAALFDLDEAIEALRCRRQAGDTVVPGLSGAYHKLPRHHAGPGHRAGRRGQDAQKRARQRRPAGYNRNIRYRIFPAKGG